MIGDILQLEQNLEFQKYWENKEKKFWNKKK